MRKFTAFLFIIIMGIFFIVVGSIEIDSTVETQVVKEHFVNGVYVLELNGCHLEVYGRGVTAVSIAITEGTIIIVPKEYLDRRVNAMNVRYITIKE